MKIVALGERGVLVENEYPKICINQDIRIKVLSALLGLLFLSVG